VAGTYALDVQASGRTASGIPFERNVRIEKHIAVKATGSQPRYCGGRGCQGF